MHLWQEICRRPRKFPMPKSLSWNQCQMLTPCAVWWALRRPTMTPRMCHHSLPARELVQGAWPKICTTLCGVWAVALLRRKSLNSIWRLVMYLRHWGAGCDRSYSKLHPRPEDKQKTFSRFELVPVPLVLPDLSGILWASASGILWEFRWCSGSFLLYSILYHFIMFFSMGGVPKAKEGIVNHTKPIKTQSWLCFDF